MMERLVGITLLILMNNNRKRILAIVSCVIGISIVCLLATSQRAKYSTKVISGCRMNLRKLTDVKLYWLDRNHKPTNYMATWNDLREEILDQSPSFYRVSNGIPLCPEGGVYTIGRSGQPATCSMSISNSTPGHFLYPGEY